MQYFTDAQLAEKIRPNLRTVIVVPCYNEASRLDMMAFIGALDQNPLLRFVFVNDGSKDETLALLHGLQSLRADKVTVVDLAQNSGKAEAVRQGMLVAARQDADMVGYWDADLATPLYAIDDLLRVARRLDQVQVVYGSRRNILGHAIDRTLVRRLVSKVCATLASMVVRLPLGDTQCGAKLFRKSKALQAALNTPFTAGWLFDVELFTRIRQGIADPRICFFEFPLTQWDEIPGSKVTSTAILKSGLMMLRLLAADRLRSLGRVFGPSRAAAIA